MVFTARTILTGAASVTACAVLLAGCGDDDAGTGSDDRGPDDATSGAAGAGWAEVDACTLLDDAAVADLLGADVTSAPSAPAYESEGRPVCSWGGADPYTDGVRLRVWDPPAPEIFDSYPTRAAGEWEARVVTDNPGSCELEVASEPAWVTIDVDVPSGAGAADSAADSVCDQAAALAASAADALPGA